MLITIKNKLIVGFSSLVGILLVFGLLAWLYIGWLGKNIDEIAEWKVPAVKLAVDVHAGAYDATIEQLNYLLYERPEIHERAKKVLQKMEGDLTEIDHIAARFDDNALLTQSSSVRKNVSDFRQLYDRGVAALVDNKRAVETMVSSGERVLRQADAFAEKQEKEYAQSLKNNADQALLNSKVQKYIVVNRIKSQAQTIIQHEKEERLYKDRNYYAMMQEELPTLMGLYDRLEQITREKDELKLIDVARKATEKYSSAAAQWIDNDNKLKVIVNEMDAIAADARQSAAAAEADGWGKAQQIAEKTVALVGQANTIIIVTLLLGVVIGIGMAIMVPKTILNSIIALSQFAKSFGKGDLTARTHFKPTDEIGIMAQDFDQAAKNIHQIVSNVSDYSQTLQNNSMNLLKAVEKNTTDLQTQKEYTLQVVSAMSQMASTVQEVARNAGQAASATSETDSQAAAGRQVVMQAVESINTLAGEIFKATSTVEELQSHVNNISSILDVIRSVSEQTNLLALNAAIEAARAGEHGRGFAVVADEVRTLASRTQSSTNEIQCMIEKLQIGAKDAVTAMGSSQSLATQSVEKAQESGNALEAISSSVSTINSMNAQIAVAAEQQSSVTEQVNRNVIKISEISESSVKTAQDTSNSGKELAHLAEALKSAVSQFKL